MKGIKGDLKSVFKPPLISLLAVFKRVLKILFHLVLDQVIWYWQKSYVRGMNQVPPILKQSLLNELDIVSLNEEKTTKSWKKRQTRFTTEKNILGIIYDFEQVCILKK